MHGCISPLIIKCAITDMDYIVCGQIEVLCNAVCHIHHSALLLCANVVGLPDPALLQNDLKSLCHILHVEV